MKKICGLKELSIRKYGKQNFIILLKMREKNMQVAFGKSSKRERVAYGPNLEPRDHIHQPLSKYNYISILFLFAQKNYGFNIFLFYKHQ